MFLVQFILKINAGVRKKQTNHQKINTVLHRGNAKCDSQEAFARGTIYDTIDEKHTVSGVSLWLARQHAGRKKISRGLRIWRNREVRSPREIFFLRPACCWASHNETPLTVKNSSFLTGHRLAVQRKNKQRTSTWADIFCRFFEFALSLSLQTSERALTDIANERA